MKRILTQWAVAGVLLLGAPVAAGAGPLQQAGAAQYLPFIAIGVVLVVLVVRHLFRRPAKPASHEPGQRRSYGVAGGVVCRSCGLPFARNALDLNMVVGKLVRCPHCGKWAVLPAASPAELAAAEERAHPGTHRYMAEETGGGLTDHSNRRNTECVLPRHAWPSGQ